MARKGPVELSPLPLLLLHHGHPRAEQAAGGHSARVHQGAEGEASTPPNRTHPPLPPTPPQRQPIRFNVRQSACTRASRQCSKHLPRGVGVLRAGSDERCIAHTHTHTHIFRFSHRTRPTSHWVTLFSHTPPLSPPLSLSAPNQKHSLPDLTKTHTFPPHTPHTVLMCLALRPLSLPLPRERM